MQTQLSDVLSESLNFVRQVEINRAIKGVYPLSTFARLNEMLASDEGFVTVKLEFGDCVGFACLQGKVSANLIVECQRCLKPVETAVSGTFKFALVHSEEEFELLPEELEPYLIEGEEQSIIDLVEDELLLSLPMVTVHEEACSAFMAKQNKATQVAIQADRDAEKEASNPFAVLKTMRSDKIN